jgi:hypothetical protein
MSTTPIDTWAVDLADVTKIYPWVGSEFVMALVAIVIWIVWHFWQIKHENQAYADEIKKYANSENLTNLIDGG